jgi:ATP-dependent Clp protease ATP-binding subunit ClpC
MFQRYTDATKRAIYFAAQLALYENAAVIESTHLFRGLLTDSGSRANDIFRLHQLLPEDAAKQSALKSQQPNNKCELILKEASSRPAFRQAKVAPNTIGLGKDGKRILAYAVREANGLLDYWIDTEHLVLGILRAHENAAASTLRAAGLDLDAARQHVIESKNTRPARPDPVLWWVYRRPLGVLLPIVFLVGLIVAFVLLGVGGAK